MKTLAELGHAGRTQPCREYPGRWETISENGITRHASLPGAKAHAQTIALDTSGPVSVFWECTPGDPRIGKVWFTPFYRDGYCDEFGIYRT